MVVLGEGYPAAHVQVHFSALKLRLGLELGRRPQAARPRTMVLVRGCCALGNRPAFSNPVAGNLVLIIVDKKALWVTASYIDHLVSTEGLNDL